MNNYLTRELDRRYGAMQDSSDESNKTRSVIDLALKAYLEEHPTATGIDADFKEFAMAQIKLFIFAGHDTTSTGAVFTYHLLAKYPEALAKVRAEHTRVFGIGDAAPLLVSTPSLLSKLTYTLAVIKESLRLYPTVAAWREGQPDFAIVTEKGQSLPTEHCMVWGDHYGTHYNPLYWDRPEEFLPERFLVAEEDPLHPPKNGWRAFERGPRNCIGQELALTEIKVMLALTVREIDFADHYEEFDQSNRNPPGWNVNGQRAYMMRRPGAFPADHYPCKVTLTK